MGIFNKYFGGKVKTGSGFKQSYGPESLHKILRRAKYNSPSTLGNLSTKDLDKLEKLIASKARRLPTGASFGYHTKLYMKRTVSKWWRKNEITKEDLKDFHNIIDAL